MHRVAFEGTLNLDELNESLSSLALDAPAPLLIDCTAMEGYDEDARSAFTEWMKANAAQLGAVAVVTDRPLWRPVLSAIGLAAKKEIKIFDEARVAQAWLEGQ